MREICSYGSVGVPAGNRRHYPENAECGSPSSEWGEAVSGVEHGRLRPTVTVEWAAECLMALSIRLIKAC